MMKSKKETWFCMKVNNVLLPFTTRYQRRKCIQDAILEFDMNYEQLKANGYRAVPIIVSERLTPNTDENGK